MPYSSPFDEAPRINAFEWSDAFPQAVKAGGFDVVIGNPPWLMAGYYVADSMDYFHRHTPPPLARLTSTTSSSKRRAAWSTTPTV